MVKVMCESVCLVEAAFESLIITSLYACRWVTTLLSVCRRSRLVRFQSGNTSLRQRPPLDRRLPSFLTRRKNRYFELASLCRLCGCFQGKVLSCKPECQCMIQARLQQQLAKPRPAPPPQTFSDQTAVPRAQAASAAQAPARTAAPATAAASHGQPAVVHVTSAAGPQAQHHLANAEAQLPPAKHQVQLQQQQPAPSLAASDGIPVQKAASPYTCPVSNVKGGYNARQKGSGQASLDFVSHLQALPTLLCFWL